MQLILADDSTIDVRFTQPVGWGVAVFSVAAEPKHQIAGRQVYDMAVGYVKYDVDGPVHLVPLIDVTPRGDGSFDVTLAVPTNTADRFTARVQKEESAAQCLANGLFVRGPISNIIAMSRTQLHHWLDGQKQLAHAGNGVEKTKA